MKPEEKLTEDKDKEVKETKELSRRENINKSLEDLEKEIKEGTEKKEEKEKEKEIEKETENESNEEYTPEQVTQALNLFNALNDPEAGPILIRAMAEKAGIGEGATKKEQKEVVRTINDVVLEHLGPEFSVLGGKLSKILETVVPAIVMKVAQSTTEKITKIEQNQVKKDLSTALDTSFDKYEDVPKKVQEKIRDLMDDLPPSKNVDPVKYFDRITRMAADEIGFKLIPKIKAKDKDTPEEKTKKIVRNQRDAFSRLASEGAAEVKEGKNAPQPQFKSRRAAIEDAIKKVEASIEK